MHNLKCSNLYTRSKAFSERGFKYYFVYVLTVLNLEILFMLIFCSGLKFKNKNEKEHTPIVEGLPNFVVHNFFEVIYLCGSSIFWYEWGLNGFGGHLFLVVINFWVINIRGHQFLGFQKVYVKKCWRSPNFGC